MSEPIPTLLNPVSLLWTWHFQHGVYVTTNFSLIILWWCLQARKMVGLKYDTKICQSNENFLHINKIYRCILC